MNSPPDARTASALSMFLLTAALLVTVAVFPDAIPMCFNPSATTVAAGGPGFGVCPSGEQQSPAAGDILIVAGLGAIGGALGALVSIRNLRGTSTPYSVSTALAVLKGPSGALTAIIGMLLLAGGFVPGLTNLDTQRQILAYALIFGIAQQLVTRVADDRAQQILDQLPSKDPQAQPAGPSVTGRRHTGGGIPAVQVGEDARRVFVDEVLNAYRESAGRDVPDAVVDNRWHCACPFVLCQGLLSGAAGRSSGRPGRGSRRRRR